MIFLAHIGIGRRIARPWSRDLPAAWLVLGTILPDVIDKPLYYGLAALTGKHGIALWPITGTRTLGHSLLLVLCVTLVARRGSSRAKALAIGLITHLILDFVGDLSEPGRSSALAAAFFPLFGGFQVLPFHSLEEHLSAKMNLFSLSYEGIGALLLLQDWLRRRSPTS